MWNWRGCTAANHKRIWQLWIMEYMLAHVQVLSRVSILHHMYRYSNCALGSLMITCLSSCANQSSPCHCIRIWAAQIAPISQAFSFHACGPSNSLHLFCSCSPYFINHSSAACWYFRKDSVAFFIALSAKFFLPLLFLVSFSSLGFLNLDGFTTTCTMYLWKHCRCTPTFYL